MMPLCPNPVVLTCVARCVAICVLVASSVSCATAPAPLPTAPMSDAALPLRLAYAERYGPALVQTAPLGTRRPWTRRATLTLLGGEVVRSPADLLPAVSAGSATARAATAAVRAEDAAELWGVTSTVTTGTALVGLTVFVGLSIAVLASDPASDTTALRTTAVATGIGSVVVASVGGALSVVASTLAEDGAVERETAFFSYGRALRQRLAIDTATPAVKTP